MSGRGGGGRREGSGWKFQGIVISNMVGDSWWCVFHFCFACGGWCEAGVLFKKKVVYVQQKYGENMATGLLIRVVEEEEKAEGRE